MQMNLHNYIHKDTVYFCCIACSSFPNNNGRLIYSGSTSQPPGKKSSPQNYLYFAFNVHFKRLVFACFE